MNGLKKVKRTDRWIYNDTKDPTMRWETNCKFNSGTRDTKYVKILSICLAPVPAKVIYPGVKNPMMDQVRDMWRRGYLNRFVSTDPKDKKFYYQTTNKGRRLLHKIMRKTTN